MPHFNRPVPQAHLAQTQYLTGNLSKVIEIRRLGATEDYFGELFRAVRINLLQLTFTRTLIMVDASTGVLLS